jgi:hypothetical protein
MDCGVRVVATGSLLSISRSQAGSHSFNLLVRSLLPKLILQNHLRSTISVPFPPARVESTVRRSTPFSEVFSLNIF